MMARYNAWQNKQLVPFLGALTEDELRQDRKAFFGSILATLNHILWADAMWLHRFGAGPEPAHSEHLEYTATLDEWCRARAKMDAEISAWADGLTQEVLDSDLRWTSKLSGQSAVSPMAQLVMHVFNHQTHHRGQVHAMLTAAGQGAPVSDIPYLPKDA